MKKVIIIMGCLSILSISSCRRGEPYLGKSPVRDVVAAMTLEEKAALVVGTGMEGASQGQGAAVGSTKDLVPGAAGTTRPLPRLGITPLVLADGPAGLRIDPVREGDTATYYCTHFPIGTLLASTWNPELIEQVGKSMGEEVKEYGADILLAPALNIHRNPLNGRNFEYYSEDPVVSGKTAAAFVRGVQSNGVGTSIKHFAFNNQETNRTGVDAVISPRAIREIYLKGFEIAVKESDPWTVMTSYNKVNGTYTSQSRDLVTTILREEWGFRGLVMTDWYGGDNAAEQIAAGNDLMEPGTEAQYRQIVDAVKAGTLPEKDLDECVERLLDLVMKSPRFKGYAPTDKPDLSAHAQVTRASALEGMVLLKNEGGTLPLKGVKSVAVFGNTSYDFIAGGTGSGNVNRAYTVSLIDGLRNGGYKVDDSKSAEVLRYMQEHEKAERAKLDPSLAPFLPVPRPSELLPTPAELRAGVRDNDVAIITIGRTSGEFFDRTSGDFVLNASEKKLLGMVCDAFHKAGKKVVVVLNVGGVIETASWKDLPDAILLAWQAGQEGGNSVTDILSGKQNPSGKLTMTFPVGLMDAASSRNFPVDLDVPLSFIDRRTPTGEKDVDVCRYEEGIYVGYRWFDKQNMEVSYPFGYGLSYTTFGYSEPRVVLDGDVVKASVRVSNTGSVAGKEVVQLYVGAPDGKLDKPVRELKAYAKTSSLAPGQDEVLEMTIALADLASFDESLGAWVVDEGTYDFQFASTSRDVRHHVPLQVKASLRKVSKVLAPGQ